MASEKSEKNKLISNMKKKINKKNKTKNKIKKNISSIKNKKILRPSKNKLKSDISKNKLKPYEFIEHTADVKFLAYGKTIEEAFANSARATIAVMTDISKIEKKIKKKILVEANTIEALLYDFLEEIIYVMDTEGFLMSNIESIKIERNNPNYKFVLNAQMIGDIAKKYDVHTYIKAVTYNDMKIKESKNKFTIQVVHDI